MFCRLTIHISSFQNRTLSYAQFRGHRSRNLFIYVSQSYLVNIPHTSPRRREREKNRQTVWYALWNLVLLASQSVYCGSTYFTGTSVTVLLCKGRSHSSKLALGDRACTHCRAALLYNAYHAVYSRGYKKRALSCKIYWTLNERKTYFEINFIVLFNRLW